jgi:integrase
LLLVLWTPSISSQKTPLGEAAEETKVKGEVMAIFKRGKLYWYHFVFNGEHVQRSTKQGNPRVARQIESAYKTQLAKGEVNLEEREKIPSLTGFKQRFLDEIRVRRADHPETIQFYECKYAGLLKFMPLAQARLDHIDEKLIAQFTARMVNDGYERSTINRHLATMRRTLRLAAKWRIIDRVPTVESLSGENQREFVLARDLENDYFDACPEFLRNWARLALETGMRRKQLRSLKWADVHVDPVGKARLGYIHVRGTKSRNSKRNLSLTAIAQMVLLRQRQISQCEYVFVMDSDHSKPASISALNHCHERVRKVLRLSAEFVLHSLRHTFGTRLGEAGADAFTIMRIMGHSSITVSQRYVHPTPETMENAFLALELASRQAQEKLSQQQPTDETEKSTGVATVLATVERAATGVIQ